MRKEKGKRRWWWWKGGGRGKGEVERLEEGTEEEPEEVVVEAEVEETGLTSSSSATRLSRNRVASAKIFFPHISRRTRRDTAGSTLSALSLGE